MPAARFPLVFSLLDLVYAGMETDEDGPVLAPLPLPRKDHEAAGREPNCIDDANLRPRRGKVWLFVE